MFLIKKGEGRMLKIKSSLINLSVVLFLVLLISSCGKTTSSDQTTIESLITLNSDIFGTAYLDDQSADTSTTLSIAAQSTPDEKFRWYRKPDISQVSQEITSTMDSAGTTAEAVVKTTVPGTLYVFEKSGTGSGEDSFQKSFQDEFIRKGKFVKNSGSWGLSEITPVTVSSKANTSTTSVEIKGVKVYKKVGDAFEKVFEVTDPTQYIPIANFPVFTQADEVKVEFTTGNSITKYSPASYGYLHTINRQGLPWRFVEYDDGATKGDLVAADLTFTNTWSLEGIPIGIHRSIHDVLGADTFDKSSDTYCNTTSWGVLYTVQ
jgi:hypothetical protein